MARDVLIRREALQALSARAKPYFEVRPMDVQTESFTNTINQDTAGKTVRMMST